jgi:hypothetical protein
MLADIDVAPVVQSIRSELRIPRTVLEPTSEQEEFPAIPRRVEIIQCAIDNVDPIQADPDLSFNPIHPFQHVPPTDVLPMGLHLGNTYYRAALQTIVNCQELVEIFQVNRRILLHPVPMDPEMSSYHYNVLLRQRKLLSRVMQKLTNTLQEEQLELAHAIQCMLQDDH